MRPTWVVWLALAVPGCGSAPVPADRADSIYFGGAIHTMNAGVAAPEAVVVNDGRIVDMGAFETMEAKHAGPLTRMVDLDGGAMYPRYIDATRYVEITALIATTLPETLAVAGVPGTIEIGARGDFVILDGDPARADAEARAEIRVVKVVDGGETIYRAQD